MKLYNLRPILWVNDVRATIDWYVNTLGFEEANYIEKWNWGQVIKDGIRIMFGKPQELLKHGKSEFTGSLYFNVDDVESLWQKFKDSPSVYYPLETFEYEMKEFAIKDINGYILQFGQDTSNSE
jgi:uncharacterized glyoxalase superfamily protein PhnB